MPVETALDAVPVARQQPAAVAPSGTGAHRPSFGLMYSMIKDASPAVAVLPVPAVHLIQRSRPPFWPVCATVLPVALPGVVTSVQAMAPSAWMLHAVAISLALAEVVPRGTPSEVVLLNAVITFAVTLRMTALYGSEAFASCKVQTLAVAVHMLKVSVVRT